MELVTPQDRLVGFTRLSLPAGPSFVPELGSSAVIRELRVYAPRFPRATRCISPPTPGAGSTLTGGGFFRGPKRRVLPASELFPRSARGRITAGSDLRMASYISIASFQLSAVSYQPELTRVA